MRFSLIKKYLTSFFFAVLLFSCSSESDLGSVLDSGDAGVGGSFARFMLAGNFMYIVDNEAIKTFSLTNPAEPEQINKQEIGEGIETIYRLGARLFIGSTSGLYLYTIGTDGIPQRQGEFLYAQFQFAFDFCDPVVANDTMAYVTLNVSSPVTQCRRTILVENNLLNIFDVQDFNNPTLVSQYDMDDPQGVGIDGNLLFVCENNFGLKIFDVSDPMNIQLITNMENVIAHDVIPLNGLLLVVGPENVYQIDYTDIENIKVVSTIQIGA